ncbi:maleylpyruvate isomerase family mycothiol-dependent enzyme [Microbacterium sp. MPKO10]|uniref:maleylpyruvate isomerase family mycothiol-dependent enzyme n=1 Tax=Microbacterium sp. MPKO10 TaxID=2989818 RepID=UPI002235DA94|nr:maleylpyruvate isomerase family mycothiol-dependent enzyme [Microbacterium sp. MPKO10]MCW4458985.1 maleylpyruvate isomerase N-terminal domain-containing protein [Microbacterium sp. MPKO10]
MARTDRYEMACRTFIDVVAGISNDQWDAPGLGVWDVRSLTGHTARAVITVIDYLDLDPAAQIDMPTAGDYYGQIYLAYTNPEAIAKRGVEAGVALGDDPVAAITGLVERALALLAEQPDDRLVSLGGMGIPINEYLKTRVFELVVHTMDLARATGQTAHFAPELIESAASLAAGIAARTGDGEQVIMALTGRGALPPGFSVV